MSELNAHIRQARIDYSLAELDEKMVDIQPLVQFQKWLAQAIEAKLLEPYAMTISTVDHESKPSARIVLLREITDKGLVFYTNYTSKKGNDINANPYGAATFFWPELQRQIRFEGKLQKVSSEKSDSYFQSRPRESNYGAWASEQSAELKSRTDLEEKIANIKIQFADKPIARPPVWGGYELVITKAEFWQGRNSRLHDRIQYTDNSENNWNIKRLSP